MNIPISMERLREQLMDKINLSNLNRPFSNSQCGVNDKPSSKETLDNENCIQENAPIAFPCVPEESNFHNIDQWTIPHSSQNSDCNNFSNEPLFSRNNSSKKNYDTFQRMHLKEESYDFTQVKSTYTSNIRQKLSRNQPIISQYYEEHMERYGKPPFVREGMRKGGAGKAVLEAAYQSRKLSNTFY